MFPLVCWAWSNSTWWLRYVSSHTGGTKSVLLPFLYLPTHPLKMKVSPNIQRCKHTNPYSTPWRRDLYRFDVSGRVLADQGTLFWQAFWRTRDDDGCDCQKQPLGGVMSKKVSVAGVCAVDELAGLDNGRDWVHLTSSMMVIIVDDSACHHKHITIKWQ